MAEITNSFSGGKMNLDLDSKLLPRNEYREARNIIVSDSDGNNAGSLQSVLGGKSLQEIDMHDTEVIGGVVDTENDVLFAFLTDYEDVSPGNSMQYPDVLNRCLVIAIDLKQVKPTKLLLEGNFLNFSKDSLITGVNILEGYMYWTDGRNQPRKLNVKKALLDDVSDSTYYYVGPSLIPLSLRTSGRTILKSNLYTKEHHISVAKLYPYKPLSMELLTIEDDNEIIGDSSFMKDKFIRFSYRYVFNDKTFSPVAPFTSIAFVPLNDGAISEEDMNQALKTSVINTMQNKINAVNLTLDHPEPEYTDGNIINFLNDHGVEAIEIVMKESNAIAIKSLVELELDSDSLTFSSDSVEYSYKSSTPVKTLPESENVRVYDKIPVKAKSQEIVGNRLVYGNYQNRHSEPKDMVYRVAVKNNKGSDSEFITHSVKQGRSYQVGMVLVDKYGRHSNVIPSSVSTTESIGNFVFKGDSVFIPYRKNNYDANDIDEKELTSMSIKFYEGISEARGSEINYPGIYDDGITKVITSTTTYENDNNHNPLGWYSYKIVVKQKQQDYYNVYLPGLLNGNLTGEDIDEVFYTVLTNDNINKVPRNLIEVGPEQKTFGSKSILTLRVSNDDSSNHIPTGFDPDNVDGQFSVTQVNALQESDIIEDASSITNTLYSTDRSNPLIARLTSKVNSGSDKIGVDYQDLQGVEGLFTVFETEPFKSEIDIYWETASTGLVEELNTEILLNTGYTPFSLALVNGTEISSYIQRSESLGDSQGGFFNISHALYFIDAQDEDINSILISPNDPNDTIELIPEVVSVIDSQGNSKNTTDYRVIADSTDVNKFFLQTSETATYERNNDLNNSLLVTLRVKNSEYNPDTSLFEEIKTKDFEFIVNLVNESPSFTDGNTYNFPKEVDSYDGQSTLHTHTGVNGAFSGTNIGLRFFVGDPDVETFNNLETIDILDGSSKIRVNINSLTGAVTASLITEGPSMEFTYRAFLVDAEGNGEVVSKDVTINVTAGAFNEGFDVGFN